MALMDEVLKLPAALTRFVAAGSQPPARSADALACQPRGNWRFPESMGGRSRHGVLPSPLLPLRSLQKRRSNRDLNDFFRLFMAPGMLHCGGGPGPNAFGQGYATAPALSIDPEHDVVSALERWVELGVAPKRIIAAKYINDDPVQGVARTRPLCVYPKRRTTSCGEARTTRQTFAAGLRATAMMKVMTTEQLLHVARCGPM